MPRSGEQVAELLRMRYGLFPSKVCRLAVGHTTINYRATCTRGDFFVKRYPTRAELAAEEKGIAMSELAGRNGIPVATPVPSDRGSLIEVGTGLAISVWVWVDAMPVITGFSHTQQWAAGSALGRLHGVFADYPAGRTREPDLASWNRLAEVTRELNHLLRLLTARSELNEFDIAAEHDLRRRQATLTAVPAIVAGLPALTTQVLHGDYSAVNLLFRGDTLAAVLDFSPPQPFLVAYELGRIAFDPRVVVLTEDWLARGLTLIQAYVAARPTVAAGDVLGCGRVILLRLLTSLYGIRNHYLCPGPLQDDLDAFWSLRHRAANIMLNQLNDIEAGLAGLATGLPGRVRNDGS
jgi:Ser/Thr protein kinase RdoA (MazF antagonist)